MASFTIFSDERMEGVSDIVATLNDTSNSVEIICIWDATTGQLGRAAFAHHLVYPTDTLVVTPSILDLFTFDREVGLYLPLFFTVEVAVAHYSQTFNNIIMELLALPVPPQVILLTWWGSTPCPGHLCLATPPCRPGRTWSCPGSTTRLPGSTPGMASPACPLDVGSCTPA